MGQFKKNDFFDNNNRAYKCHLFFIVIIITFFKINCHSIQIFKNYAGDVYIHFKYFFKLQLSAQCR